MRIQLNYAKLILALIACFFSYNGGAENWIVKPTMNGCNIRVLDDSLHLIGHWHGACINGFASGPGQLALGYQNHQLFGYYEVTMIDGHIEGEGKATFPDGRKFNGTFVNGQFSVGTLTNPDGSSYSGRFRNGVPDTSGRASLAGSQGQQGSASSERRGGGNKSVSSGQAGKYRIDNSLDATNAPCLRYTSSKAGGQSLVNDCDKRVRVAHCLDRTEGETSANYYDDESTRRCVRHPNEYSPTGYSYEAGVNGAEPGGSSVGLAYQRDMDPGQGRAVWAACFEPGLPVMVTDPLRPDRGKHICVTAK